MCINSICNIMKKIFNFKAVTLVQRQAEQMPHDNVADKFLNDKKTSDAIKASMLPVVKKVENENWQTALETEFNKPENQEIKEDYEKIKEKIDFAKFPEFNRDTLNEIIANLKNRQQWIHACSNVDNQELQKMLLKNFEDSNNRSIFTCFGLNTKKGKKVNQLPVFNQTNFNFTVKNQTKIDFGSFINNYNNIKTTLEELAQNDKTFRNIKNDLWLGENKKADKCKKYILETWVPLIDELKKSDKFKDTLVLNDILKYINKSVMEDRELIRNAKAQQKPDTEPKNIIPCFDKDIMNKALKMGANQPFMNKYKQCYRNNIIEKYTLLQDENKKAKQNEEGFYQLDLNKLKNGSVQQVNELQFISPNSWCTHSFKGIEHYRCKHYYIILDKNKKVKFGGDYSDIESACAGKTLGSKMESSTEDNNQKFSLDILKQILKLLKSQNVEIPFKPIWSDLRYLLALAIIKEKGIDNLKEEYSSIAKEYNLPTLSKDTLFKILDLDTKDYIDEDEPQISINKFKILMGALCKNETIDETDKIKLKMINIKRLLEKAYNSKDKTSILTLNDINSKLQELGYSEINLNDQKERNKIINLIYTVGTEAASQQGNYVNFRTVSNIAKQVGLINGEQEVEFLENLPEIAKSYYDDLKSNIELIVEGSNSYEIKLSDILTKLEEYGVILSKEMKEHIKGIVECESPYKNHIIIL